MSVLARVGWRLRRLRGRLRRWLGVGRQDPDLAAFALMKTDGARAPDVYRAGKFWAELNADFEDLIWTGALTNLRNEYLNRRFAGPDPASRQVYGALLWLYYQRLKAEDETGFLERESEPTVGGTGDQELVLGRPMSLDFLQSVDEAFKVRRAWRLAGREGSPRVIVELGAGYGRLAYVCRKIFPEATYVILDLPEALACAASWLGRALPGEVVPYAESRSLVRITREHLQTRRVFTLAAPQIEAFEPGAVDAFVNVFSFAEMPRASIDAYFTQIARLTDGVFYSKQRERERNARDGGEITFESYPVRPSWRELFRHPSSLYQSFFEVAYALCPESKAPRS